MPSRLLALLLLPLSLLAEPLVLPLWPEGVPGAKPGLPTEIHAEERIQNVSTPTLTVFPAPADKANGAAVVICPGGGYRLLAWEKEGLEIAQWLNGLGVSAFVLKYRLNDFGHPAPLQDATRALRLVRSRAAEFNVDPRRIGVLGFSAGGHLAATLSTSFDSTEARTGNALDAVSARPDFSILVYAVLTLEGPQAHRGSGDNLLGADAPESLRAAHSPYRWVNRGTPPTFLVASGEDDVVPVENSLLYFQALRRARVTSELHLFPRGPHGHGMRKGHGPIDAWPELCATWLQDQGWLSPLAPVKATTEKK